MVAKPLPCWRKCMICEGVFLAEWGRRANGPWCISELCFLCESELKKKAR
jgi:hypothetical protein